MTRTKRTYHGYMRAVSDGLRHFVYTLSDTGDYHAGCGAIFTPDRLEITDEGTKCFWCEKVDTAEKEAAFHAEQLKEQRKEAARLAKAGRGKPAAQLADPEGGDNSNIGLPEDRALAEVEPGRDGQEVPGLPVDAGDHGEESEFPYSGDGEPEERLNS